MSVGEFYAECSFEGRAVTHRDRKGQPVRWVVLIRDEHREPSYWVCSARSGIMERVSADLELRRVMGRLYRAQPVVVH